MHRQIRQALADEIAAGTWHAGEPLPSEPQLAERFGVSRMTVRQALGDLAAQGLIVRRHGRATRVAAPPLEQALGPGRFYAFASEMARRGLPHQSRVLEVGLVTASHAARAALGIEPGGQVARITLLRLLGDEALMHERATFAPEFLPCLRDPLAAERSLYDLLETGAGIAVTRAVESIRPVALARRDRAAAGRPRACPGLRGDAHELRRAGRRGIPARMARELRPGRPLPLRRRVAARRPHPRRP